MFRLYSLLYTIAFAAMLPLFVLRRGKYFSGIAERFGRLPEFQKDGRPVIWIHCVSVGEANAARPLVKSLREEFPGYRIVISTVTRTGQELCKDIYGESADLIFYFPYDWRFTVLRTLRAIRPNLVIVMETEIWFNFFRETRRRGITLAIVNGRLSEESSSRYLYIPKTIKRVLRHVSIALVQTQADADRFLELGINPRHLLVSGNLKFDQEIVDDSGSRSSYFRERFSMGTIAPVILAASTHRPEERLLLEAFRRVLASEGLSKAKLFIAPRHPERFDEVAEKIALEGLRWTRRTSPLGVEDGQAQIVLLDSIGELRSVYPMADIVFVGGSLIPHGGQNILEPAIEGKAVVTGSYLANFQAIADEFARHGAFVRLDELSEERIPDALAERFIELLSDPSKREDLGVKAQKIVFENRGAVAKTMDALRPVLEVNRRSASSKAAAALSE